MAMKMKMKMMDLTQQFLWIQCAGLMIFFLTLTQHTIQGTEISIDDGGGDGDGEYRSLFYKLEQQLNSQKSTNENATVGQQKPIMVCGTRDKDVVGNKGRQKRYAVSRLHDGNVNKWDSDRLTWAIVDHSSQISVHKQRRIVRESLQVWSEVTPLDFVMVDANSDPDISVRFARRRHGPTFDPVFDGRASPNRANIFGHAWGPGLPRKGIAGDVHIDEEDDWSEENKLKGVLVHELGHSMGLSHSDDPEAIMFAVYRDATTLADDDIRGIQFLYGSDRDGGRRVTSRPRVFPTPRPRTRQPPVTRRPYVTDRPYVTVTEPEIAPTLSPDSPCMASDIDAVVEDPFSMLDDLYYVFIGDTVHHIMADGTTLGTMDMAEAFPGIPQDPDVVFTLSERRTMMFMKDQQIWELTEDGLTKDSPRSTRHMNFPEQPSYVISLFDVEGNRRLYLFGKQYWWSYYVDSPRRTQHYELQKFSRDLPMDVTFATQWTDGKLYVVSRDSYIILDTARRSMTHERPIQGKPHWLMPLCSGASCLTSQKSLLFLALISLVGFVIRR